MNKKVLVISASPRKGGNSETLADEFIKGILESGNTAEKICLYDKQIGFCKGCHACQTTKKCGIKDDANIIAEKMKNADIIVFATPIYYYAVCGQMKTMLDRSNPIYNSDYKFRDIYLIAAAADSSTAAIDGAIKELEGWIECFDKTKLCGVVYGVGLDNIGAIHRFPAILKKAYEIGKTI